MGCCPSHVCHLTTKMPTTISQFAKEVLHFSSQYGTDGNVSYVVPNLAGPCSIYPNYGDMTAACVFVSISLHLVEPWETLETLGGSKQIKLRTYGPWWQEAPSAQRQIRQNNKETFMYIGQDFVDLWFAEKVYPTEICIYETYHPGAVVQIFACEIQRDPSNQITNNSVRWQLLWSGNPQVSLSDSRIFSPPLKKVKVVCNTIRLVLHHQHLRYYTELDAVELVGTREDDGTDVDAAYRYMQKLSIKSPDETNVSVCVTTDNGCFDMLPGELIQAIFSKLDFIDLCRVAATSKLFKKHCYDTLRFVEVDLQPYWHMVDETTLQGLMERCQQLQKLSLSWCGDWGNLTAEAFSNFIVECGSELRCLRLSACASFITPLMAQVIASTCLKLQELDLSSVRGLDSDAFKPLTDLRNLTRVNLYRTRITEPVLINIIQNSPNLQHLNLGSIQTIVSFDNVVSELGKCRNLLSVNLWRARSLTFAGLDALTEGCQDLVEIDLGWCVQLRGSRQSSNLANFVRSCRKLRKLFLPAVRSVTNNDMFAIATFLTDLEQLDVLGTLSVSIDGVQRILQSCLKLRFLDLSFCNSISETDVIGLRAANPHVAIQRSSVSS